MESLCRSGTVGEEPGSLSLAFAFDPANGRLRLLNEERTVGRPLVIQFHATDRYVAAFEKVYNRMDIGIYPFIYFHT
jgi:6-phosphogluconolactonase (cycloisomerase 2 family)